jgi:oligopeptidase B
MNPTRLVWLLMILSSVFSSQIGLREEPRLLSAPKATPIPKRLENFGRTRVDDNYWLRDRTDPEVIAYLDAEVDFTYSSYENVEPKS